MVLIREAEETVLRLFSQNRMPGFIHSYIGEEAVAVGVCAPLRPDDYVTSTHRGHGHIVAKDGDLRLFFAELCGKAAGYGKGRGGSMHVADLGLGILGANGIVDGGIAIAAGRHWRPSCAAVTRSRSRSWATGRPTSACSASR
jgi:TPP-dependent pyruvate/acetoin dehydrogenase alpha subunit